MPLEVLQAQVAVVGNGPVGQTTALLLARAGLDVLVVDARPSRDVAGSRAICQQRDVLDIWDAVGVGRQVADEGVTWRTARTYHRDHELFAVEHTDRGRSPFPPWVNLSQSRTEAILDARIAAQPLIRTRWGVEVRAVRPDADGTVELSATSRDGDVRVDAQFVVLCAGGRASALRESLGLGFDGTSSDDRFLICDVRAELPGWQHERRFWFDPVWNPGRQVLVHACPGSVYRIDWQVPPGFDLDHEEQGGGLDRRVRAVVGDRPYEVVWRSVYRFSSRLVDRMQVGRVLLAGDVAHQFAPFGARGLNSGVQDAENAAWKIAAVAQGWAPELLLTSYHDERHAAARENLDVTDATMRFLVPRSEDERRRRLDVLDRAAHDPAARAAVDSGRLAEPYWYAASPLTTPDPRRAPATRPPRGSAPMPGPGVLVPDLPLAGPGSGTTDRLRVLARAGGLVLLVGTEVDDAAVTAAATSAGVPARVVALASLDAAGDVAHALGAAPDEVWVLRPDAHVAAVLARPVPGDVSAALRRAVGHGPAAVGPPNG